MFVFYFLFAFFGFFMTFTSSQWVLAAKSLEIHPTLGAEPTFTNQKLIHAALYPLFPGDDVTTKEGLFLIREVADQVRKDCPECQISKTIDKNGRPAYEVQTPYGFEFQITMDCKVIEIILSPLTIQQTHKNLNHLQRLIWLTTRKQGLFPNPYYGGAHVNLGFQSAFRNNLFAFTNYLSILMSNSLALREFGAGPMNSPTLLDLPADQQEAFAHGIAQMEKAYLQSMDRIEMQMKTNSINFPQKKASRFQDQLILEYQNLSDKKLLPKEEQTDFWVQHLITQAFHSNPKGQVPADKFQAVSLSKILDPNIEDKNKVIEHRFFLAFKNAQQMFLAYLLTEGWAQYAWQSASKFVTIQFQPDEPLTPEEIFIQNKYTVTPLNSKEPLPANPITYLSLRGILNSRFITDEASAMNFMAQIKDLLPPVHLADDKPYLRQQLARYAQNTSQILPALPEETIHPDPYSEFHASRKPLLEDNSGPTNLNQRLIHLDQLKFISPEELQFLQAGITQRIHAIWAFLKDLQSAKEASDAFESGSLSKARFERLLRFYHLTMAEIKNIPLESAGFFYGIDIIRHPQGHFVGLEDNIGNLGGMADVLENRLDFMSHHLSSLGPLFGVKSMEDLRGGKLKRSELGFLEKVVQVLKKKKSDRQVWVIFRENTEEMEHLKFYIQQLRHAGAKVITLKQLQENPDFIQDGDAVLLRTISPRHRDLPIQIRDKIQHGQVTWVGSSALWQLLSNKEFMIEIPSLIRHYLHQEPLLDQPEIIPLWDDNLESKNKFREDLLFSYQHEWPSYVLKLTNAAQGVGVYFQKDLNHIFSNYFHRSQQQILQRFVHPSTVGHFISDFRLPTLVVGGEVHVSDYPWSRAIENTPSAKMNVSDKAMVLPVFLTTEIQEQKISPLARKQTPVRCDQLWGGLH